MSTSSVAYIRWGGQIIRGPYGADYEGGFSACFAIGMISKFEEFIYAIANSIHLQDNGFVSNVLFRQPVLCQDGVHYDVTPVANDLQFFLVIENCRKIGMLDVLQFYVGVDFHGLHQHKDHYNIGSSNMGEAAPEFEDQEEEEEDDDDEEDPLSNDDPFPVQEDHESADDDDEDDFWLGSDDDDDDDDQQGDDDDEQGTMYENPILPLVHPPPYSEIDFSLMEVNTYSKPGGKSWNDPSKEFALGMVFASKDAVATAAAEYSMHRHTQFRKKDSRKEIYDIKCAKPSNECQWRLRAIPKKKSHMWTITKYNGPHTCTNIQSSLDHRQLNQKYISCFIEPMVTAQPDIKVKTLQEEMKDKLGYQPTYRKTWKAKQMALERIFGGWDDSYGQLPRFLTTMSKKNPGSSFVIEDFNAFVNQQFDPSVKIFDRCFWTFNQCVQGFKYCRPIIFVDGTFLYGKYSGCLLCATTLDGNNQIFPLAFAVVEKEDIENWQWFMTLLRVYVTDRADLCVISDRHNGIIRAMESDYWREPIGYHRYCIRHILSNFNRKFKNTQLKEDVRRCAYQCQESKFINWMSRLRDISPEAGAYLDRIPVKKWTRCFDGGYRYGSMTTNAVESVNGMLKGARALPITAMINKIFLQCAHYFDTRRTTLRRQQQSGFRFTHWVGELLQSNASKANGHTVSVFDSVKMICQIKTRRNRSSGSGGKTQVVNLEERSCSCTKFQEFRIPCSHAIAAAIYFNINYEAYVDECYSLAKTLQCYQHMFNPLGDEAYWENVHGARLVPNADRIRKKGRPKASRHRSEMDWPHASSSSSERNRCAICGKSGHNRQTCSNR